MYLENGIKDEFITKWGGEFVRIDDNESLEELELLVSNINAENQIVFRANHGSNAYNIAGTFPQDKKEMLGNLAYKIEPYPKGDNKRYDSNYSPATQTLLF